ncbi:FAD binding domain-containing protein [Jiangella rhizosphaerae]|uniref:Xanthine dehydrogenase family protein subunit M n=1 Tax=Jiangella rhizosphaerae TaxID=2293569 RepID=A0A418KJY9_9ACTN|nr:xanthine dehydrogenase family protein subunit M [Jiangella rhizosphaerae]RIQ14535.1 xanthine dehydrogenase family protein subunit M [Jiangella rhizosphaerae]
MIPAPFDYTRVATVEDAVAALAGAGEDGKVLAGGQSLLPMLRLRLAAPTMLVDLGGVAELRGVRDDGDALIIGAMTTHDEVVKHPLVREHAPLIAQAAETVGDRQIRHLGTFGGSLAHADPAGDLPGVALALDAVMSVAGPGGMRDVRASEFFVDYFTTALGPGDVLVSVRVPKLTGWTTHYEKFHQMAQSWSVVGVAAAVRRSNGSIAEARVALTNMGVTPVRAHGVEEALAGAPATADAVATAAARAADGASPLTDGVASAEYRTHLASVLTKRAVMAAGGL